VLEHPVRIGPTKRAGGERQRVAIGATHRTVLRGGLAHHLGPIDADCETRTRPSSIVARSTTNIEDRCNSFKQVLNTRLVGPDCRPIVDLALPGQCVSRIRRPIDVGIGETHLISLAHRKSPRVSQRGMSQIAQIQRGTATPANGLIAGYAFRRLPAHQATHRWTRC
jgi:hypothetical protein